MNIEYVKISEVRENSSNPRILKDKNFRKLVKSIKDFPKMLELRPIVVDDNMVVLGGNMRLKACLEVKMTHIPIIKATELTAEQQKEFVIKDNSHYGEWDFDILANEFDMELLIESNIDIPKVFEQLEEDLDELNSDFHIDESENEEKEKFSHFIIICNTEKEDDLIREKFNLGVKTKSSRGKYESNVIDAEKIVSLFK